MSDGAKNQTKASGGGYYSGANPVPTVKEFLQNLDPQKENRDKKVEEKRKERANQDGDPAPQHHQELKAGKGQKIVTDPVTQKETVIEDADKAVLDSVDNPKVRG